MDKKHSLYLRWVVGILAALIGIVLMLIPFIPFGYAFVCASILILAPMVPFLKRVLDNIRARDKRGFLIKIENVLNRFFDFLHNGFKKKPIGTLESGKRPFPD